jgi:hypothetical protein
MGRASIERPRFFPRQLVTPDDLTLGQEYFRNKLRRMNRYLHGWGVVCGCDVQPLAGVAGWKVRVCPGYAVGPQGDEILVDTCVDVDLQLGTSQPPCTTRWPCPPTGEMPSNVGKDAIVYIAVRYAECYSRPVSVHPAGCGCDETGCEYSRIRDSFELKVLWELPASHTEAAQDDTQWCTTLQTASTEEQQRLHLLPAPPCPPCVTDPWVVLAAVRIPQQGSTTANGASLAVSYASRRVLLATQRLQTALVCVMA